LLAFRIESGIVYFNTEHIFDTVIARLEASGAGVRCVICDLSTSAFVDMAGARMCLTLYAELAKRGIPFRLVEARSTVRDMLRAEGVEEKVGRIDRFTTLAHAIDDFQKPAGP
jgi:MFS superfamily sulfate permease-like transporter